MREEGQREGFLEKESAESRETRALETKLLNATPALQLSIGRLKEAGWIFWSCALCILPYSHWVGRLKRDIAFCDKCNIVFWNIKSARKMQSSTSRSPCQSGQKPSHDFACGSSVSVRLTFLTVLLPSPTSRRWPSNRFFSDSLMKSCPCSISLLNPQRKELKCLCLTFFNS